MRSIDRKFLNKHFIAFVIKTGCKHFLPLSLLIFSFLSLSEINCTAKSLDEIIRQAEEGSAARQIDLARAYLYGRGIEQDYEKAFVWYKKAADQGDPTAQTGLGWLYENGKGVKQDYMQARLWYQKAVDQGSPKGQAQLGLLYERGHGVEKDPQKAAHYYRKAADQGLSRAQVNLGILYEKGLGVEKDMKQAVFWYKKSTAKNYARGQTRLGLMYEQGFGLQKDLELARVWYSKAADQGYTKAKELLKRLERRNIITESVDEKSANSETTILSPDKETPHSKPQRISTKDVYQSNAASSKGITAKKPSDTIVDSQLSAQATTYLFVNEDTVLVKKDPAAPPPFIIKVAKGTRVVEKARQGDWVSVVVADTGRSGWILSSQLEERTSLEDDN